MSYTIPTVEPEQLNAGDRWQWTKSIGDFPADSGWTLTYYMHGVDDAEGNPRHITISGSADGADHSIDVAAATTATYVSGDYFWRSFVSDGTSRYFVEEGKLTIAPDFATTTSSYDGRSSSRKILDTIRATILRAVSRPESSYSFSAAGQSFSYRSLDELRAAEADYAAMVMAEEDAAKEARGIGTGRNIYVRFNAA